MPTINQGILITAAGMGLVFLMILALWGIMVLLVKLTNKPEPEQEELLAETSVVEPEKTPVRDNYGALAAAIAVAYALESEMSSSAFRPRPCASAATENAWWTAGRTQQLYSNTIRGRKR